MARNNSRMNRYKSKERKRIIIAIIFLLCVLMTAAYAAYQRDLIINGTGKIYNDWELRFTDLECTPDANTEGLCSVDVEHLGKYELGIELENDGIAGGYALTIYTEFIYPEDEFIFDIEITNFSDKWEALLDGISYNIATHNDDYIIYEIESKMIPSTYFLGVNSSDTFTVTVKWNPLKATELPGSLNGYSSNSNGNDPISKDKETITNETYTEEQVIFLTWVPRKP